MPRSSSHSRRKMLAGGAAAVVLPVLGQPPASSGSSSTVLSAREYALLSELTDRIIPRTDTPGAVDAGVPAILDGALRTNPDRLRRWKTALAWFSKQAATPEARLRMLERISMEKDTEGSAHFALLKAETIDLYYSTEAGLKTELGWNANTFLSEFKGCTHPEHQG